MQSRFFLIASIALFLAVRSSRSEILDGLAGHWSFDETSSLIAADHSKSNNSAQLFGFADGAAPWTGGRMDGGISLGGPDKGQFLLVSSYAKSASALSVSVWVWADAAPAGATIARNWAGTVAGQFQLGLLDSIGGLQATIVPATGAQITVREGVAFPLGSWQHVALVADGQQVMLFRNGALLVRSNYTGPLKITGPAVLGIGAKANSTGTDADPNSPSFWQGKLDDLGIWTRALDPEEVMAIYTAGLSARNLSATDSFLTPESLQVSEFMASNTGYLKDQDGDSPDWVELLNGMTKTVNLSGWYLSDSTNSPLKWAFPSTNLAAKARLVVFASGKDRRVPGRELHTSFSLSAKGGALLLVNPVLKESATWIYPPQIASISYGTTSSEPLNPVNWRYYTNATPGRANNNGVAMLGPRLDNLGHASIEPNVSDELWVTVKASVFLEAVKEVQLTYRVMFSNEVSTAMLDDGQHHDGAAGDGTYGAAIPAGIAQPGEMIRYRATATDGAGRSSRWPLFLEPNASAQYAGTIVRNPALTNALPVLHWFVQNKNAAETGTGTRCSVYYAGEFYDNIFARIRGGTSRSWPKHSYKMEFNENDPFQIHTNSGRVSEINLNTTYTDKSYLRAIMHYEIQRDTGLPSPETFPIRMQQNGAFFSVALFTEQPDSDFLRRNGLDSEGSLYKCGPGSTYEALGSFEKKTRKYEGTADLQALITGLKLTGTNLENFVFDNLDVPMMVTYMATTAIAQNIDGSDKNHFIYRDSRGTGEWFMLPWDLDLSFGPNALNTDTIVYNQNFASHPFLGARPYTLDSASKYNRVLEAMFKVPRAREMVLRRIRTMTEEFLLTGYFSNRIDQWLPALSADVDLDKAKWKTTGYFPGINSTLLAANNRIKTEYLSRRAAYLIATNIPGITTNNVRTQPADASIVFGQIDPNPISGNQEQEYIELRNTNSFPVDMTGWRVAGSIQHAFKPSTVIPANSALYLTPQAGAFRMRQTGPRGGQGLFVQNGYQCRLPGQGGQLQLLDNRGRNVAEFSYAGEATMAQRYLRVVEIMYHPAGLTGDPFGPEDYEYVALQNIGSESLDLAGARFTQGLVFVFTNGPVVLAPSERLYVVKNRAAFISRYGTGLRIIGDYEGQLSNGGDTLQLVDAAGEVVLYFSFSDKWQPSTDGLGSALEVFDRNFDPAGWGNPANWRTSTGAFGTPVFTDSDGDGIPDFQEIFAGSDPAKASSKPGFNELRLESGSVRLAWLAVANRQYTIVTSDTLSGPWTTLREVVAQASDQPQSYTDSRPALKSRFYRLLIRR